MDPSMSIDSAFASVKATSSQLIAENQQAALSTGGASGTQDASKIAISDLGQLASVSPEFAKLLEMTIAQQMCNKSKRDNDRMIQKMKEERQRNGG
jgi:hypothetical protein